MGKRVDYEALISVYDNINRKRDLTEHEQASLDTVMRRKRAAESSTRYREKNRALVNEKQRCYRSDHPERKKASDLRHTAKNSIRLAMKAREWRERNPDKAKEYSRARKARLAKTE